MSWQLSSTAIVLLSLALCFWWYERTRPSSKEAALVATMAALAALGRDAFAALPDVKPTTTIVFICGYAFGAGPGFAVGAIGALASNIFLGQGSWTPWQMLAWAIVGVGGALLGRLLRRRALGRWTLGLACALAAELFNLLLDVYSWSLGGTHTLAAYGAWVASAFAFDLTHVIASFVFGFTFGPALLRMLVRARTRLEIVWRPLPGASLTLVLVLLAATSLPGGADAPSARAAAVPALAAGTASVDGGGGASAARLDVSREIAFLQAAQNPDGGFGAARGQASSELYSAWAAIGLAAAGREPASLRRDGHTVLDALRGEAASLQGAGDLERTILALRASGASVHALPGGDPLARLLHFRRGDGSFSQQSNLTAFAVFALRAAGRGAGDPLVRGAVRWLERQQEGDGGFGFATRGGGSDVDDTAAVAAGDRGQHRARARRARPRRALPRARPESRWRLSPAARRRIKRPVDRVGDPGPDRGRQECRRGHARRQPLAAGLPGEPPRPRRQRALLAHRHADPRMGDRAGAHGARAAGPSRSSPCPHARRGCPPAPRSRPAPAARRPTPAPGRTASGAGAGVRLERLAAALGGLIGVALDPLLR